MREFSKLVRDNIPDIIRRNGEVPIYREASEAEFRQLLVIKLVEEARELCEAAWRADIIGEFADLKEVAETLGGAWHIGLRCLLHRPLRVATLGGNPRGQLFAAACAIMGCREETEARIQVLSAFNLLLEQVVEHHHLSMREVRHWQNKKRVERGGFEKRIYLIKTLAAQEVA